MLDEKVNEAIKLIKQGFVKRVDLESMIVYKVGNIIRIDIKDQF